MPRPIVHFEIPAGDVGKMTKFYSDLFGWKFKKAPMPGMDYWMISTGPQGKSLAGGMYGKESPDERPRFYVQVDSVDKETERFKQAGGTIVVEKMEVPGTGFTVMGLDPEGNLVGLFQPVRSPRRATRSSAKKTKRRR
jgi:predicted enzyme related to lactoylglutathione lyase